MFYLQLLDDMIVLVVIRKEKKVHCVRRGHLIEGGDGWIIFIEGEETVTISSSTAK